MNCRIVISALSGIPLCAILLGPASPVSAHDLWLERAGESIALRHGHHAGTHEGAAVIPYAVESVVRIDCADSAGQPIEIARPTSSPIVLAEPCAVVFVLTSSGIWTKTPFGTENLPREACRQPIMSWRSFESAKWIDRWSPRFSEPITDDLEIVPLRDPFSLKKGAKLPLLVTYRGEPAEGAILTYDGKPRGVSSEDGRLNVRLRHAGFQMIQASLRLADSSGTADEVVHATALNFVIGAGP